MDLTNTIIGKIEPQNKKYFIAGPCSFASFDELYENACCIKDMGIEYLRAGVFKPRTSPYSFQGLREDGIDCIKKLKSEMDIKVVSELMSCEQVKEYEKYVDIVQVGSRNMFNYELLKMVGKLNKPVILKRSFSATIEEWLMSAEYIAKEGNKNIILCERGIRSFDKETRNVLDLQAVAVVKNLCNLPVIVDPSHASGRSDIVPQMALASLACGADGLLIEAHKNPQDSKSDGRQTISMEQLRQIFLSFKNSNK